MPLSYRPDLLLGEVTGSLTGVNGPLGDGASSVTIVSRPDTGAVLGFDARPQPGASAPIPFSVPFNVTDVDPAASYVVTGQVTDGDRTWESATGPAVITNGNPITPAGMKAGRRGPCPSSSRVVVGAVTAVVIARRGAQPPPAPGGDGAAGEPGDQPAPGAEPVAGPGPGAEPGPGPGSAPEPDAAAGSQPGS